jgi:SH3 domain protein
VKKILSAFFVLIMTCGIVQAKPHYRGHTKHTAPVAEQPPVVDPAAAVAIKDPNAPVTPLEFTLTKDKELLNRELTDLKKTAANALQIKIERDDLQQKFAKSMTELEQLKADNKALKDSANQDWFLYGGGLALAGVLLGFILPKISWGRRNTWGSF